MGALGSKSNQGCSGSNLLWHIRRRKFNSFFTTASSSSVSVLLYLSCVPLADCFVETLALQHMAGSAFSLGNVLEMLPGRWADSSSLWLPKSVLTLRMLHLSCPLQWQERSHGPPALSWLAVDRALCPKLP